MSNWSHMSLHRQIETSRRVFYERLFQANRRRGMRPVIARVMCHMVVGIFHVVTTLIKKCELGSRRGPVQHSARIVLTGTFFADNWIEAHVRPLANSNRCAHVWVIADHAFVPIEKVTYICAPKWLQRIIGRVPARSLMYVLVALWIRADIVGGFHLLCNGLLALLVARMCRARAMYFCVGGWAEFVQGGIHGGNQLFMRIGRGDLNLERALFRAIRQFDLVLTMGTGARSYFINRQIPCPVEVMPGGIDSRLYSSAEQMDKQYDLITVSRLVPVKRLDVFLEVVHLVSQTIPSVTAVIVGDGEELERLRERSKLLGLTDRVSFVGRQQNVPQWLNKARIFVLTSDSEGLSLALMEAMMAGLPAVVSDVGDLGDLVVDEVSGFRPIPGDVRTFALRIIELLSDTDRYRQFAVRARRAAEANSIEMMRNRWDHILARWAFVSVSPREHWIERIPVSYVPCRRHLWEWSRGVRRYPAARKLSAIPPTIWLGRRFRRNLYWVRKSTSWGRDELAVFQLAQLQRIVRRAFGQSPYYRQVYRQCGFEQGDMKSIEDLTALPTIDADTVRMHLLSMCTQQRHKPTVDVVSTGGSGGKLLRFFIDVDRSAMEYAHLIASWQRAGYQLGIPMAVLRGKTVSPSQSGLRHEYDPLLRHHYYSNFHMTDENMARYLEHIATIGECFLHVYPSSVAALARFISRSRMKAPPNIRGIIAESENVYPEERKSVEQVFGCRYFSCYGHTEKLVLAAECEHSTDYHVWPTYGYFELLDEQGRPVTTPGQRGEIVGTGFINTVMPFIRYRTGDYATYVGDHCEACGRQHTIIRDIRGHRIHEVLVAADGSPISWTALNMHDDTFARVRQFQFYQDTPGRAVLRVVPAPGFGDADQQRIRNSLGRKLDGRLTFTIQITDTIPLTPRGKTIYVDQRIPDIEGKESMGSQPQQGSM